MVGSCELGNEVTYSKITERLFTEWETSSFSRTLFHGVSYLHNIVTEVKHFL